MASVIVLLVAALAGCGEADPYERVAVAGSIQLDGRSLEKGRIVFIPLEGVDGQQVVGTIHQGQYEIEAPQGPVCGPHHVQVFAEFDLPYNIEDAEAHAAYVAGGGSPQVRGIVASRFNVDTELTAHPTREGPNRFDFAVFSSQRSGRR